MSETNLDLSGQIIDERYRVESRIGQGGMGVVWRARHVQTRQLLALKTVRDAGAHDRKLLRRFLYEARAAAAIQSRNVVRIVDVKPNYVHQGIELPFIVMEFLEGMTLADFLEKAGAIDASHLVWLMRNVCRGLSLAHQRGIVHRDLKPSNIFLCKDDEGVATAKLCDFGIAKFEGSALAELAETGAQTADTGALFGTPRYMAPEQLERAGRERPSTDQWAFALIAFHALSGRSYFEGARNLAELILAIVHNALPQPSKLSPLVPKAFDSWFLRSCARNPDERFPSVTAQQQGLELALGWPEARPIDLNEPNATSSCSPQLLSEVNSSPRQIADVNGVRRRKQVLSTSLLLACVGFGVWWSFRSAHWLAAHLNVGAVVASKTHQATVRGAVASNSSMGESARASTADASVTGALDLHTLPREQPLVPSETQPSAHAESNNGRRMNLSPEKALLGRLPRGAPCSRSSQCEHGYCAAEVCR